MRNGFFGRIDIKVVLMVMAALLLLMGYWAVIALSEEYYIVAAPEGSTFSSDATGLKVLYNYLDSMGVPVQTLQEFDELPEGGTIVVVADEPLHVEPTHEEGIRLRKWVADGGRLVLVGAHSRDILVKVPIGASRSALSTDTVLSPLLPSFYSDGVSRVRIGPTRFLTQDAAWVTHMKDIDGQVMASRAFGDGEIVWLSSTKPFTNAEIDKADDARLSTLVVAAATPVYFDEYHHGFVRGGSVWDRLGSGGQVSVLLVFAALLVLLVAVGRRLGPPIEPVPERPARSGAYIGSLAELYRKAGARAETLESLEEGLREALARRYGSLEAGMARHPDAADALERSRAARKGRISVDEFVSIARRMARARQEVEGKDVTDR